MQRAKLLFFDRVQKLFGVEKPDGGQQSGPANINLFFLRDLPPATPQNVTPPAPKTVESVTDVEAKPDTNPSTDSAEKQCPKG